MGKIYKDQTALKLRLNTGIDLTTGVSTIEIKYIKPGDPVDTWTAGEEDTYYAVYSATAGEIDTKGDWKFWAYITFTDSTVAPGEPVIVRVYDEGE
jgi:hypothetical protein